MLTAIVIVVFLIVIIFDFLPASGRWSLKERILYLVLFSVSFAVLLLSSLNVQLPSISNAFIAVLKKILPHV